MQLKYWYRLILHHMKCMTCSQILFTCNSQYVQGHILFKFLQFLILLRRKGRKMAQMSLNVYTTLHPLCQTSLYVSRHWLPDQILEVASSLARWEVSLRWPSVGCRQIHTMEWIVMSPRRVGRHIVFALVVCPSVCLSQNRVCSVTQKPFEIFSWSFT